jgi:putative transposase
MGLSERRACNIVAIDHTTVRYTPKRPADRELRERLRELANARRRFGYRRLFILLRQAGERSGQEPYLPALPRGKGLRCANAGPAAALSEHGRQSLSSQGRMRGSLDFVHDQFACGRRFRVLNIVDDVTRECLAAIPDTSISAKRVARELSTLIRGRGKPE